MVWFTLIVYKNVWVAYTYGANVKLKSHNAFHNASHMRYQPLAMKKNFDSECKHTITYKNTKYDKSCHGYFFSVYKKTRS